MKPDPSSASASRPEGEKDFLHDAAVFHGKLLLYGVCDLLLFPVALIAAAIDLIRRSDPVGRHFYSVVHFGKAVDEWIDLYGAAHRAPESVARYSSASAPSFDELLNQFEAKLRAAHENGDISASARQTIGQMLKNAKQALGKAAPPT